MTFKGGTSLSKVYKVIDRFSEDIDLTYDIRELVPDLLRDGNPIPASASQDSVNQLGAMLQVQDSGPGLAPGVAERLFRPFFTTKNDGNGLGLWISLGLVERYGGSIGAGNREDGQRGAVLSVRLLTEPRVPDATPTRDGRPGLLLP